MINLNAERLAKINMLQRKNRRNNLIKVLSFMHVDASCFLDSCANEVFCKTVFSVLDTKEHKIQIHGANHNECMQTSMRLIHDTLRGMGVTSTYGRLLFFRDNEIEAVRVPIDGVCRNVAALFDITKFSIGLGDFILVAEDFRFGLCIERTEYFYECSVWGLS